MRLLLLLSVVVVVVVVAVVVVVVVDQSIKHSVNPVDQSVNLTDTASSV